MNIAVGHRSLLLRSAARVTSFAPARTIVGRRFVTTKAPHLRSRSWKSSALRWGIAFAGIYYYNTSPVFAESPEHNLLNPNVDALEDENPTLDALTASSRRKVQKDASVLQSAIETSSARAVAHEPDAVQAPTTNASIAIESPEELEEEAAGEGAFNPITGEINWDCPCLGGMAYGPCGPQFREAFSCFVYSTEDPKGMDCIDKFQAMQNCFREHPEVYKGEIEDEEELDAELAQEREQLAQEIAERKKVVEEKTQSTTNNRLLEEPIKPERTQKQKKSKKETESKAKPRSQSRAGRPESIEASSSEPHPGMSSEHEALNEGTNAIASTRTAENELVPRAAHDASNMPSTAK